VRPALVSLLLLCACWDFDKALVDCQAPDGACILDAGASPDGGVADGGSPPDAGPAWTLVYGSNGGYPVVALCAVSPNEVWMATYSTTVNLSRLVQYFNGVPVDGSPAEVSDDIVTDGVNVTLAGEYGGGTLPAGFAQQLPVAHRWGGGELVGYTPYTNELLAAWVAGTQIWLSDAIDNVVYRGSPGSSVQEPGTIYKMFRGTGVANNDFWTLGAVQQNDWEHNAQVFHYQGGWGTPFTPAPSFLDIFAAGPDDIFAVGLGTTMVHFHADGGSQNVTLNGAFDLYSVWAPSPTEVFAAGADLGHQNHGVVVHLVGTTETDTVIAQTQLTKIHGSSATDVWAGDADGGLWHYAP
jgi:hypothetical protein